MQWCIFRYANKIISSKIHVSWCDHRHFDAVKWKIIGVTCINLSAKCVCSTFTNTCFAKREYNFLIYVWQFEYCVYVVNVCAFKKIFMNAFIFLKCIWWCQSSVAMLFYDVDIEPLLFVNGIVYSGVFEHVMSYRKSIFKTLLALVCFHTSRKKGK